MALELASWNIKDGFSDADRIPLLLDGVFHCRPDFIVFPEAYAEGQEAQLDNVREDFDKQAYTTLHALYDDPDGRLDRHGIFAAARTDVLREAAVVSLAGRSAVRMLLEDPAADRRLDTVGAHFDDRTEERRLQMVTDLRTDVWQIDTRREDGAGFALAMDGNAMHRGDRYGRALRMSRCVTSWLPKQDPNPFEKPNPLLRAVSLGYRLGGMASGRTMAALEEMGLRDADPTHTPTMLADKPVVQLDHIMVSSDVRVVGYQVFDRNAAADHGLYTPVSDHRAIAATVALPCRG